MNLKALVLLVASLGLVACSGSDSNSGAITAKPSQWQGSALVRTEAGDVQGSAANDRVWSWFGIPFAQPPVGELRWRAPKAAAAWPGVLNADTLSPPCAQIPLGGGEFMGDENCLKLNIWRPRNPDRGLPVYVWIHGGGNTAGDAMEHPEYNGANFAEHANAVFVSINYRLGALGWFVHSSLANGDPATDSGNFGTLDIIASLQWIKDNIEAFGGNPNNVTIHGQSAGAIDVISLLLSPPAKGLFDRAIVQSGFRSVTPMADARAQTEAAIIRLLIADGTAADSTSAANYLAALAPADIAAYLRRQSPETLLSAISISTVFADGHVIPADGLDAFISGSYPNKVPVMIGSTEDEARIFVSFDPALKDRDDVFGVVADYGSDFWKVDNVDTLARQLRSHADQPPVYVYLFQWGAYRADGSSPIPAPWDFRFGSTHNVDTPFFFRNDTVLGAALTPLLFNADNLAGRNALNEAISNYTSRFARNGDPNGPDQREPRWQPWSNQSGKPKQVLLNVAGDSTAIAMSNVELTLAGVLNSLLTEVPQPLAGEALDFMRNSRLFCAELTKAEGGDPQACE